MRVNKDKNKWGGLRIYAIVSNSRKAIEMSKRNRKNRSRKNRVVRYAINPIKQIQPLGGGGNSQGGAYGSTKPTVYDDKGNEYTWDVKKGKYIDWVPTGRTAVPHFYEEYQAQKQSDLQGVYETPDDVASSNVSKIVDQARNASYDDDDDLFDDNVYYDEDYNPFVPREEQAERYHPRSKRDKQFNDNETDSLEGDEELDPNDVFYTEVPDEEAEAKEESNKAAQDVGNDKPIESEKPQEKKEEKEKPKNGKRYDDWEVKGADIPSKRDIAVVTQVRRNLNIGWGDAFKKVADKLRKGEKEKALRMLQKAGYKCLDLYRRAYMVHGDGDVLKYICGDNYQYESGERVRLALQDKLREIWESGAEKMYELGERLYALGGSEVCAKYGGKVCEGDNDEASKLFSSLGDDWRDFLGDEEEEEALEVPESDQRSEEAAKAVGDAVDDAPVETPKKEDNGKPVVDLAQPDEDDDFYGDFASAWEESEADVPEPGKEEPQIEGDSNGLETDEQSNIKPNDANAGTADPQGGTDGERGSLAGTDSESDGFETSASAEEEQRRPADGEGGDSPSLNQDKTSVSSLSPNNSGYNYTLPEGAKVLSDDDDEDDFYEEEEALALPENTQDSEDAARELHEDLAQPDEGDDDEAETLNAPERDKSGAQAGQETLNNAPDDASAGGKKTGKDYYYPEILDTPSDNPELEESRKELVDAYASIRKLQKEFNRKLLHSGLRSPIQEERDLAQAQFDQITDRARPSMQKLRDLAVKYAFNDKSKDRAETPEQKKLRDAIGLWSLLNSEYSFDTGGGDYTHTTYQLIAMFNAASEKEDADSFLYNLAYNNALSALLYGKVSLGTRSRPSYWIRANADSFTYFKPLSKKGFREALISFNSADDDTTLADWKLFDLAEHVTERDDVYKNIAKSDDLSELAYQYFVNRDKQRIAESLGDANWDPNETRLDVEKEIRRLKSRATRSFNILAKEYRRLEQGQFEEDGAGTNALGEFNWDAVGDSESKAPIEQSVAPNEASKSVQPPKTAVKPKKAQTRDYFETAKKREEALGGRDEHSLSPEEEQELPQYKPGDVEKTWVLGGKVCAGGKNYIEFYGKKEVIPWRRNEEGEQRFRQPRIILTVPDGGKEIEALGKALNGRGTYYPGHTLPEVEIPFTPESIAALKRHGYLPYDWNPPFVERVLKSVWKDDPQNKGSKPPKEWYSNVYPEVGGTIDRLPESSPVPESDQPAEEAVVDTLNGAPVEVPKEEKGSPDQPSDTDALNVPPSSQTSEEAATSVGDAVDNSPLFDEGRELFKSFKADYSNKERFVAISAFLDRATKELKKDDLKKLAYDVFGVLMQKNATKIDTRRAVLSMVSDLGMTRHKRDQILGPSGWDDNSSAPANETKNVPTRALSIEEEALREKAGNENKAEESIPETEGESAEDISSGSDSNQMPEERDYNLSFETDDDSYPRWDGIHWITKKPVGLSPRFSVIEDRMKTYCAALDKWASMAFDTIDHYGEYGTFEGFSSKVKNLFKKRAGVDFSNPEQARSELYDLLESYQKKRDEAMDVFHRGGSVINGTFIHIDHGNSRFYVRKSGSVQLEFHINGSYPRYEDKGIYIDSYELRQLSAEDKKRLKSLGFTKVSSGESEYDGCLKGEYTPETVKGLLDGGFIDNFVYELLMGSNENMKPLTDKSERRLWDVGALEVPASDQSSEEAAKAVGDAVDDASVETTKEGNEQPVAVPVSNESAQAEDKENDNDAESLDVPPSKQAPEEAVVDAVNRTSVETPKADNEGPVTVVKSKTEETPGTVKPYHFKNEEYFRSYKSNLIQVALSGGGVMRFEEQITPPLIDISYPNKTKEETLETLEPLGLDGLIPYTPENLEKIKRAGLLPEGWTHPYVQEFFKKRGLAGAGDGTVVKSADQEQRESDERIDSYAKSLSKPRKGAYYSISSGIDQFYQKDAYYKNEESNYRKNVKSLRNIVTKSCERFGIPTDNKSIAKAISDAERLLAVRTNLIVRAHYLADYRINPSKSQVDDAKKYREDSRKIDGGKVYEALFSTIQKQCLASVSIEEPIDIPTGYGRATLCFDFKNKQLFLKPGRKTFIGYADEPGLPEYNFPSGLFVWDEREDKHVGLWRAPLTEETIQQLKQGDVLPPDWAPIFIVRRLGLTGQEAKNRLAPQNTIEESPDGKVVPASKGGIRARIVFNRESGRIKLEFPSDRGQVSKDVWSRFNRAEHDQDTAYMKYSHESIQKLKDAGLLSDDFSPSFIQDDLKHIEEREKALAAKPWVRGNLSNDAEMAERDRIESAKATSHVLSDMYRNADRMRKERKYGGYYRLNVPLTAKEKRNPAVKENTRQYRQAVDFVASIDGGYGGYFPNELDDLERLMAYYYAHRAVVLSSGLDDSSPDLREMREELLRATKHYRDLFRYKILDRTREKVAVPFKGDASKRAYICFDPYYIRVVLPEECKSDEALIRKLTEEPFIPDKGSRKISVFSCQYDSPWLDAFKDAGIVPNDWDPSWLKETLEKKAKEREAIERNTREIEKTQKTRWGEAHDAPVPSSAQYSRASERAARLIHRDVAQRERLRSSL